MIKIGIAALTLATTSCVSISRIPSSEPAFFSADVSSVSALKEKAQMQYVRSMAFLEKNMENSTDIERAVLQSLVGGLRIARLDEIRELDELERLQNSGARIIKVRPIGGGGHYYIAVEDRRVLFRTHLVEEVGSSG